jgi:hydroxymethylbilane synthase
LKLVLATRRSPLAVAQSEMVARSLRASGNVVELLHISTTGDRRSRGAAGEVADVKGLFVKELEEAILGGWADAAVHSAKDLPTELPDGLAVLCVPKRVDPRDVFVGPPGGLDMLPLKARVGTGSPRRQAQLHDYRRDIVPVDIRGNVDTRIAKLSRGEVQGLVLAAAGMTRLGLDMTRARPLDPFLFVPAPGQGCLAIEGRRDRVDLVQALLAIDHAPSRAALQAERAFLRELGGGCFTPVGALCEPDGDELRLTGYIKRSGRSSRRGNIAGPVEEADALGRDLARTLGGVR